MRLYRSLIQRGWWILLIGFSVALVALGRYVPHLKFEATTQLLMEEGGSGGAEVSYYQETRPVWGWDEYAMFCVRGVDWFSPDGLHQLQTLVGDLQALPHVKNTFSILDVPLLRQKPGQMPDLKSLPRLSSEGIDLEKARRELVAHEVVSNNLVSPDGTTLNVLVYLDVPMIADYHEELKRRRNAMIGGLRKKAAEWSARLPEPIRLAGVPIININLIEHIEDDVRTFSIVSLAFFALAFLVIYRRPRYVLFPLLTCVIPVVLIVGAMVAMDIRMTIISCNLPVLLFVLMLPYTVYFIERQREEGKGAVETAGAIWTPCLYSCLTTVTGFVSLMLSTRIKPVRTLGEMMTWGMLIGLVLVFLFMPALMAPLRAPTAASHSREHPRGIMRFLEQLVLRWPLVWVVGGLLLFAGGVVGALRLSTENKFTKYFWPTSELYQGLEFIDVHMGGTTSLEIILEGKEKNHFLKKEGLEALAAVESYFKDVSETGKVHSFRSLVAELDKVNPLARLALPTIAGQKEFRSIAKTYATEDYSSARVFVRMRETAPTLNRNKILDGLRKHLDGHPKLKHLKRVEVTGVFSLYATMLNTLIKSQKDSIVMVLAVIYAMLVVLFRNLLVALIVLLPQALPVAVMLGVMGWCKIPLDIVTVTLASIAMGVGIDAAIQYTVRYCAELKRDGDRRAAISRVHATTGRAIWVATSVIVAGFCTLMLSRFVPTFYFGAFTAIAMLMSQFAALLVLPALFLLTGLPRE